ncbi:hypothetical protein F5Y17DRAFT_463032 [Xylariaceae sp. FL0594]|nr:hypothetical protein F5Y17DRAFT_463032 [Xylariaceae sp. FL0594]
MARYSVFSDAFWCRTYEDIELDQIEDCDQAGPSSSRTSAAAPLPLPLPPRPESKWSDDSSRVEPMHRRFRLRIAGQLPRLSPLRLRAESPVRNEENETPVEGADGLPHAESEIPKPRNGFEVAREQTEGPDLQPPQLLLPPPVSQVPRTHIAVHRHRTWTGRVLHRYTPVLPSQRTPRPPRWPSFNPFNHRDRSEPREEESPIVSKSRASLGHITICLSHFCAHAGIGQTLPLLRAIAIHFNIVDVTHLSMMVSGYALALAVYILVARKLSLVFDPKKIFILGLVWSAIWTIVAGAAFYGSVPGLIASRSSQGLGIAFTLPTGLLLLKKVDPPWISNATKYLIYHMMAPVGLVVGALGASVLGLTWWPRAYWAYLCVLAMLSILGGLTLPSGGSDNTDTQRSLSDFVSSFDLAGMITGVGSLYLIGFAWTQAGIVGWDAPYLYIIGSVGISVGVAFVLVEKFYACDPLVPQSVQSWKVIHILFVVAVGSSSFGIWLFYGWQFLQSLALVSPLIVSSPNRQTPI